jgi:hypothetical protein
VEDQMILEVFSQINPFVRAKYPQGKADERPHMNNGIVAPVMLAKLMNLGMTIMATGNTIIRPGFFNLFVLQPAECQPLFFHPGLQKTATAAAAVVIGPVGNHVDKIFFPDYRFDHISQIFGNRITIGLAHDLAGILHGKFNFQILVPVGVDLELAFPDPFCIVFIDVFDNKVMLDVEFFQSCQD